MFDVGFDEMLLVAIVAIVVIGPRDLPRAMRTVGRWVAKMRRMSGYFRSGVETMIREAELEDMERQWRKQNEAIMQAHPSFADPLLPQPGSQQPGSPEPASAEAGVPAAGPPPPP